MVGWLPAGGTCTTRSPRYAAVFAGNAAAMAAASAAFCLMGAPRRGAGGAAGGLVLSCAATAALAAAALAATSSLPLAVVWPLLSCLTAGMGLILPAKTVPVQAARQRSAGTATSISGGLSFLVGAAATPLVGLTGSSTVTTMAVLMMSGFVLAVALDVGQRRRRRGERAVLIVTPS